MKSVIAALLLAVLPIAAFAQSTKIVVRNGVGEQISLSLTTAQGKQIYSPVKLNPNDRYELNDPEPGTIVLVSSTRCGHLKTDLPGRVDWTVEVRPLGNGCELVKTSKSYK
jgi:hypothetical protein